MDSHFVTIRKRHREDSEPRPCNLNLGEEDLTWNRHDPRSVRNGSLWSLSLSARVPLFPDFDLVTMKSLKIISYNVRGLVSRQRRVSNRCLLLHGSPDVVSFQERKHCWGRLDGIENEVWRGARWICAPAEDGVHARRNPGVEAGIVSVFLHGRAV